MENNKYLNQFLENAERSIKKEIKSYLQGFRSELGSDVDRIAQRYTLFKDYHDRIAGYMK